MLEYRFFDVRSSVVCIERKDAALKLVPIKRTDVRLQTDMTTHYSCPKGFVGRNICYAVMFGSVYYGSIVGGSATLHLVGRDAFFKITEETKKSILRGIVNNVFYHIERQNEKYPVRNMVRWF